MRLISDSDNELAVDGSAVDGILLRALSVLVTIFFAATMIAILFGEPGWLGSREPTEAMSFPVEHRGEKFTYTYPIVGFFSVGGIPLVAMMGLLRLAEVERLKRRKRREFDQALLARAETTRRNS